MNPDHALLLAASAAPLRCLILDQRECPDARGAEVMSARAVTLTLTLKGVTRGRADARREGPACARWRNIVCWKLEAGGKFVEDVEGKVGNVDRTGGGRGGRRSAPNQRQAKSLMKVWRFEPRPNKSQRPTR